VSSLEEQKQALIEDPPLLKSLDMTLRQQEGDEWEASFPGAALPLVETTVIEIEKPEDEYGLKHFASG